MVMMMMMVMVRFEWIVVANEMVRSWLRSSMSQSQCQWIGIDAMTLVLSFSCLFKDFTK